VRHHSSGVGGCLVPGATLISRRDLWCSGFVAFTLVSRTDYVNPWTVWCFVFLCGLLCGVAGRERQTQKRTRERCDSRECHPGGPIVAAARISTRRLVAPPRPVLLRLLLLLLLVSNVKAGFGDAAWAVSSTNTGTAWAAGHGERGVLDCSIDCAATLSFDTTSELAQAAMAGATSGPGSFLNNRDSVDQGLGNAGSGFPDTGTVSFTQQHPFGLYLGNTWGWETPSDGNCAYSATFKMCTVTTGAADSWHGDGQFTNFCRQSRSADDYCGIPIPLTDTTFKQASWGKLTCI
jgi:hypothetical protein